MAFQKPKGTQDWFPEEMAARNAVFELLRSAAKRYGFQEVSSPAFESLSILTRKEGEEITQQIFTLEKKGSEELGLRFDLTVPLTRMFLEKQKELTKPVKWFALDRMWRYERQQRGRQREFYQLSVECFGADSVAADAEIISLAIDCLRAFGLTEKEVFLKLNSRVLLQSLITPLIGEAPMEAVIAAIDKKGKLPAEAFREELKKAGVKQVREVTGLLSTPLERIEAKTAESKNALEGIRTLLSLLGEKKKFVRFDLSVARGLAYYTGIVFEAFDTGEKFRALLGGGRYDKMVEQFGGQATPATGFGLGYSTLALLLEEKGLLPKAAPSVEYAIAPLSGQALSQALRLASELRKKYTVDVSLISRNLNNQMNYARKIGAKKLIVIGEEELRSGSYTLKDLETGKEEKKSF